MAPIRRLAAILAADVVGYSRLMGGRGGDARTAPGARPRAGQSENQGVPRQEGKDIVVLNRWAEDRTEGAVFIARAIAPGIGIMKVPARVAL